MITMARHKKDKGLYNDNGTVGTPTSHFTGEVYCDTCGADQPQRIDVYHPQTDSWERGVPCPMHNSHPH